MCIKRCVLKNWFFTVFGGLLILGSSAISGIYVVNLESSLSEKTANIANEKLKLEQAHRAYESGLTHGDLASIHRSIVRYSVFQNEEIQGSWDSVHSASLYAIILGLRTASGLNITDSDIAPLNSLREKAENGDKEAYSELQTLHIDLIKESAMYRANMVLEIAKLEADKSEKSLTISTIKEVVIFIQLLGLIILLIKEVPIHITSTSNGTKTNLKLF